MSGALSLCGVKLREGGASSNHERRSYTASSAATGSSASRTMTNNQVAAFSPTKSVSSLRVMSGANQMNSGASIANDSAKSGKPAAIE